MTWLSNHPTLILVPYGLILPWVWFGITCVCFLVMLYFLGAVLYIWLPMKRCIPCLAKLYFCCPRKYPLEPDYDELL
jgi:hypothetical protein